MNDPRTLSDAELVEQLELGAQRQRMAATEDLRTVANLCAGLALAAAERLKEFAGDRTLLDLRRRASRLEDAAFHFQTCSTCRREGDGACESGRWFAAYLCGEIDEEGAPPAVKASSDARGPMLGKVRDVVLHSDGRLTCSLEVSDAGAEFIRKIKSGDPIEALGFRKGGRSDG